MNQDVFNWKIGGEAGNGIMATGLTCSKVFASGGYNIFDYTEYPSLIRGGHNTYSVCISKNQIRSARTGIDLLIALNDDAIKFHSKDLNLNAAVIFDPNKTKSHIDNTFWKQQNVVPYPIPLYDLVKSIGAEALMINTAALGASLAIVDYGIEILDYILEKTFANKESDVIEYNKKVAHLGFDYIKNNFKDKYIVSLPVIKREKQIILAGNEATALGAIRGGCKLYAAYPMTPASSILQFMAQYESDFHIAVKQSEDEIAAINMALGGSFAGVRSMVGTSGGGFALMVEALGMAGAAEIPIVIFIAQRAGPSTGLPTWTEQGDLQFVRHASQGEFPRIIIAPGDIEELFYETIKAFNLAEKYQLPVIILSDRYLAESHKNLQSLDIDKVLVYRDKAMLNDDYKRYEITQNGISPRSIPSDQGKQYLSNSDEHDELGYSIEGGNEMRVSMVDKRARKSITALVDIPTPQIYSNVEGEECEISFVSWGSNKGAILDALDMLKMEGIRANFLHVVYIEPFVTEAVVKFIQKGKIVILVENNKSAQLGQVIKENTGLDIVHKILKYDGRPIFAKDVVNISMSIYKRWQQ